MTNNHKTVKFRKFQSGRFGIIIFVVILLYIFICLYISSQNEQIVGYQVKKGALSENRVYTGIALRDEHVVLSSYTGYINYYIRESERSAYNNLVYCIDESGKFSELIGKSPVEDNSLNNAELKAIKQDIMLFSKNFDEKYFSSATVFEAKETNYLNQLENRRIVGDLNSINSSSGNDRINYCRAPYSGITLLYEDGFETKTPEDILPEDFDTSYYSRKDYLNDDLIEAGSFVYKYVFDENWSIVIKVEKTDVDKILSYDYIEVKFLKTLTSSWGKVSKVKDFDDFSLISLEFTNSMVSFSKDRFVDVELLLEEDSGLKVPNTSISEKMFFLIDKDYVFSDENDKYQVLRDESDESGTVIKYVTVDVYKEDDDVFYVDSTSVTVGNVLLKPESTDKFIVSKQGSLTGVYNINKGYAEFNRIDILYSNDEYSIINPSSVYGVRAYDYIALDASKVSDKDFVY